MRKNDDKGTNNIFRREAPFNLSNHSTLSNQKKIDYIYTAQGTKLKKVVTNATTVTTTDYAGNFVYTNNALAYIIQPKGYMEPNGSNFRYVYQYKDNLGSNRLSYTDYDGNGTISLSEVTEEDNYYPFGLKQTGYNNIVNGTQSKYKYNGKELQDDAVGTSALDWYDYGARFYDAGLGRFHTIDPLSEKYSFQSPFVYGANNPVRYIDIDGKGIPPIDNVYYQRELVRRTGNKKDLQNFNKGIQKANKTIVKGLGYAATGAAIVFGGAPGIILGIPSFGLQTGKDIASVAGSNKKKIDETANTITGVIGMGIAKVAGKDIKKGGQYGDLFEAVFVGGNLLKDTKTAEDVILNVSSMVNIGFAVSNVSAKNDKKTNDNSKNKLTIKQTNETKTNQNNNPTNKWKGVPYRYE